MNIRGRAERPGSGHRRRTGIVMGSAVALVLAGCGAGGNGGVLQPAGVGESGVSAEPPASAAVAPPLSSGSAPSAAPVTTAPTPTTSGPVEATVSGATGRSAVRYGDNGTLVLTVVAPTAAEGTDLSGAVSVGDGTTVLAEGTTDPSGHATLDFYDTVDPGDRTWTVTYGGNAAVRPATGQVNVHTTTTNVDIAIDKVTGVLPGQPATIAVRVIGTPQAPSGQVTVSVDGAVAGQGAVDGQGRLSATVPAVAEGTHQIAVSYAGDVRFDPATASATFTVTPAPVNPNQAGAAAVQAANPCPATADACVDLTNEQAWLQSGGTVTYGPVPITSGKAGSRTRAGTFSVFWKDKDHKSSLFNDAAMPNSVFFDGDIAFHQGSLSRQSNGCIHLSWDDSATFFGALSTGSTVAVFGAAPY